MDSLPILKNIHDAVQHTLWLSAVMDFLVLASVLRQLRYSATVLL
jgi:hypothetical protein